MSSFALQSGLAAAANALNSALLRPETKRQLAAFDADYVVTPTYFFELILPPQLQTGRGSYLFPLQIGPQSVAMSEPFAIEVTPTQNGGLFVEEQGIVQRRIRLRGNTGFWPTPLEIDPPQDVEPPQGRSFGRKLPHQKGYPLSGMRHFQFLQDSVFRLYGDLKRDPTTAAQTSLVFHDPQSDEHWLVAPMSFASERTSSQPLIFPYELELLVLDKAQANAVVSKSPDQGLLAALKSVYGATQQFLVRATAAVQDLTAVQDDLRRSVQSVGATLGQVATLISAVSDFVGGTIGFVRSPYRLIFSIAQAAEAACATAENARRLGNTLFAWPRPIVQRFRAISTACEQLGLASKAFIRPASTLQSQRAVGRPQDVGGAAPNFRSFAQLSAQGSAAIPSDPVLQGAATQVGAGLVDYPGTFSYQVKQGDSLTHIASRFLGAPQLWSVVAAANNMALPIIPNQRAVAVRTDDRPLGTVLSIGQVLNIPSRTAIDVASPDVPVVGASPDATAEAQLFGTDLLLRKDASGKFDLQLGSNDGMADFAVVTGVKNVEQAAATRVGIERGSAAMYPLLGLERLVGTGRADVDLQGFKLRVVQALEDDGRIESVSNVQVRSQGDRLEVSVDARLKNLGQSSRLNLTV